ncbi:PulM Type II secretory pathway, component PulM [Burkholderiaceae bacterium]
MSTLNRFKATLATRWQALSTREQRGLTWLGMLLAAALIWTVAIAPALDTLRDSHTRRAHISTQQAHMLALQAQAQALQQRTPLSRDEALRTLQSLSTNPSLQLTVQGERVSVQLKAMPASTLATWLAQVRSQAQVLPIEAHLTRGSGSGNEADKTNPTWNGSVVLRLPDNTARAQ